MLSAAVAATGVHCRAAVFVADRAAVAAFAATAAVSAAAVAAGSAAAAIVTLVNSLPVQGRHEVARKQCSRGPAWHTRSHSPGELVAIAGVSTIGRITSPLTVIDIAASAAADQIALGLSQSLNRTVGEQGTGQAAEPLIVSATVAGRTPERAARIGAVAHWYSTSQR
jgi:hypothetical protein